MAALTDLTFEQFVDFQFGHAVRPQGNPWYFDTDGDWWWPEPRTGVGYLTRLFSEGPPVLQWFSDAQIAQGLTGLINTMAVGDQPWMRDPVTPANERAAAWDAIAQFFADVLAPRCSPTLGHLSEEGAPLNLVTYMWWESFPGFTNPYDPERELVDQAELDCLRSVLALEFGGVPGIRASRARTLGSTRTSLGSDYRRLSHFRACQPAGAWRLCPSSPRRLHPLMPDTGMIRYCNQVYARRFRRS